MTPILYVLVLGVLIYGTIAVHSVRKKRWAFAVWAPMVVLDIRILMEIFGAPPGASGSGPDGGAVDMEVGFFFLGMLPMIICTTVSLIVAAISFPRKLAWNLNPSNAAIAAVASIIVWFVVTERLTPKITFRVVDENGKPLSGTIVKFSMSSFGSGRPLGTKITDGNGKVKKRLPWGNWTANATGNDSRGAEISLRSPDYRSQCEKSANELLVDRASIRDSGFNRSNQ